ncbi:hypothetical protein H7J50_24730 [Mycobacterium intermedium]|uniref:hypothetical protein n=1 Tax=Mycobacterium intermedium TaxID=28445 RepID=UPI00111C2C26|nr:hypothetical protein [Mycobacterium intermedium]MCV6966981.1 hypothetical protein [Mycobacterium intermedium]
MTSQDHDLGHIVSDGELLLISAVIAAAAAGDLLSRKRKRFNLSAGEMAVVGGAMLLLFGGGGTYAGIAALNHLKVTAQAGTNDEVKKYLTTMISADNGWPEIWCWSAFGASLLLGACSIFVIALEEAG